MLKRVVAVLFLLSVGVLIKARADVVLDWNALMLDAIRVDTTGPTLSSRNLAILHTAIYDAVNSVARTHQPYRFQLDAPAGASAEAAAVAAAYTIVKVLYPPFVARADDLYQSYLATAQTDASLTNGLQLGALVGVLTLESRNSDGANTEVPYIPSDAPGQWRRTPPFFRPPLTPQWRYVDTFCLPDIEPFVSAPPPALDSAEYAEAINELKAIGGKVSAVRTPEQSQIAVFWSDFSYTAMPPGHWHEIAATIAVNEGNTLTENARLFALLSVAQADSAIVCWEIKFRYNLWRPVTAIRQADDDNNPLTEPDEAWDHLLNSPPFPAYTSGHSTFSKASAQVLTHFYGTDAVTFTAGSDSLPGVFRTFQSLAACADEVGMSRIYGGIHFAFDNREGKACGRKIADYVTANFLLSNDTLPFLQIEESTNDVPLVQIHGHVGATCILEASADLNRWEGIATNTAASGGIIVADPAGSATDARFYRVIEQQ